VVPVACGHEARDLLVGLGLRLDYLEYPIGHEISEQGLLDMTGWLSSRIDEAGAP
jgi:predicted esterase